MREIDEDERREALQQRRGWKRPRYRTYDDWKLASPDDEQPPSEREEAEAYECPVCGHEGYGGWNCLECGAPLRH